MWKPVQLDFLLNTYKLFDLRVLGSLLIWIIFIFGSIWLSLNYLPDDWVLVGSDRNDLLQFFLFNPALVLGLLLLFWFGFEWAFVPVFMSMFIIGIFSHLEFYWAILFGLSFVFSLSIYAIVYHCISSNYQLRSILSVVIFITTSFVASTASSLGAFIWSLAHNLSAAETATLWNGWWAGSFLQSLIIVGPVLFLLSPSIENLKSKLFEIPEKKQVSTNWVYGAVILITVVIAIFIYSGDYLAKKRIGEGLMGATGAETREAIIQSLGSFEIITWVSIWIIICVGLGGIFLIGSWNKELQRMVKERTAKLEEAEDELKSSLDEKVVLLQEIHHRVKNNLAVVTALLDLQYMRTDDPGIRHILSDSKARVKSMAFVHETLYQTENFSKIEIRSYINRLSDSVITTFKNQDLDIQLIVDVEEIHIEMSKAVPLGLVLNELLVNAYKHAFNGMDTGKIAITINNNGESVNFKVSDNGIGIPSDKNIMKGNSLGMTLIKTLTKQLKGEFSFQSKPGKTEFIMKLHKDLLTVD